MSKAQTTREDRRQIIEAYKGGMEIQAIADLMGRHRQTIANILDKEGVRDIRHKGAAKVTEVVCPNCRAKGHYKGAKFCYKCGADIRMEADILRERLGKLVSDFSFLPESMRDNAFRVVQDAIDYLRKV